MGIAGYSEINLDLNKPLVKYEITYFDKNSKLSMSASKTTVTTSKYKRGGTITLARGKWAERVIKKGQDSLGRWSYITLIGKGGKLVKIVTTYRVCKKSKTEGKCTIRIHQEKDLIDNKKKILDPR